MSFIHARRDELLFYVNLYGTINVFYTWIPCSHCKKTLPIIQQATAVGTRYPVLQIIADEHTALQRTANLVGYPTIRQYQLKNTTGSATGQESDFYTKEFSGPREITQLQQFFNTPLRE